jgi:hypothetical protein
MWGGHRGSAGETRWEGQAETICGVDCCCCLGRNPEEVETATRMLRQRSVRGSERGRLSGEGGEGRFTGEACQTGEANGTERIPEERILRMQAAEINDGRKPGQRCNRQRRRSKPLLADPDRRSWTEDRPACGLEDRPTVDWREAEEHDGHFRVAVGFRSGPRAHAASIPDAGNVASADVVKTGTEVGESLWDVLRAACRVVCGTEVRTGRWVHWENARACAGGEIGRGGTRIRAGTPKGIVPCQVRQQWLAWRETRTGGVAMTQSERLPEDFVRDETGLSGPGEDRTGNAGADSARSSELLAPECIGLTSRPSGHFVFHQNRPRQRQEGKTRRKALSVTWEGKPLKGEPQRRYRRETKPEGPREEQSVKRLKKPGGAAQPGEASPVWVASRFLKRQRGANPMRGRCFGSNPPWVTLWSGAQVHERMRGCFAHPSQERSGRPQRSVRKTKTREGESNQ